MGLYVLDNVKLYEADEDNLIHLAFGDSVWTGCQVIAHVGPDMGVRVGAGSIRYAGLNKAVAQTDLTVTAADPAQPRIDLVHIVGATGVPAIVAGTAASTPKPPPLPATSILAGYVSVAAAAVNIQSANINDRRLIASDGVVGGLDANKPAAGIAGRLYAARDTGTLYHDDGSTLVPLGNATQPNLVLNSDFGRRTVFGLAMPEVFADTSAWTSASALGAASNILTVTTGSKNAKWSGPNTMWRDGRWSGTFKALATAGSYLLTKYVDANDLYTTGSAIGAYQTNGNFTLQKYVSGTATTVATIAQALTLNRWYWLELECQGTTYIAKLYDTGGTAPGVAKASSTLLQTLTGTISDSVFTPGGGVSLWTDQASGQWGGIATGNGGVYVETWLPESWPVAFTGTLGGQAVGYDEATDAGPLGKQWALRTYTPATSRKMIIAPLNPAWVYGNVPPSTAVTSSIYYKTSGVTGGAGLLTYYAVTVDGAGTDVDVTHALTDAVATSWTRLSQTWTTTASTRGFRPSISTNITTAMTGTLWVMLPQFEIGSAATAWRNAPADDAPIVWRLRKDSTNPGTTSTTFVECDSRDLAANLFLPWDATVTISWSGDLQNSANAAAILDFTVDGTTQGNADGISAAFAFTINQAVPYTVLSESGQAAGKHRIAARYRTTSGTLQLGSTTSRFQTMVISATRGK